MKISHVARFYFKTHGGECCGSQWIYDGDEPIALLERRTIDQPEQMLRYFNLIRRPLNLRYLKLKPGGRPLISGVPLYWKLTRAILTEELVSLEVEGHGTDRLRLVLRTRDRGGVATARHVVTCSYDATTESYVYDFECNLRVHSSEALEHDASVRLEYSDPWYVDIPAPAVEFPGMWEKRPYTHILCERADASVQKIPLNHAGITAHGFSTPVRPGGLLLPVFDAGANVAIEFVGETARQSHIGVCNWGYDIHLVADTPREALCDPILREFRIFLCRDDRARRLIEAADPVPEIECMGMKELPLYERKTSFEKPCALSQPPPGTTDAWSWMPAGEGLSYEQNFGRSDNYSLKIDRPTPGLSQWRMIYEGEGGFMEPWPDYIGFRVSGYVRTDDVTGRGAGISLRWQRYNQEQIYACVHSRLLSGTNDWTPVSVELHGRHPADSNAICIALMQDGAGTCWFDDLHVERIES